jgi:hypothetical protein
MPTTITDLRDLNLIGYDRRRITGTISAAEARSFARKNVNTKDITRNKAVAIAAQHGLHVLGAKPYFRLADSQGKLILNTAPYQMGASYSDVQHYCDQLAIASKGGELAAKSDAEVRNMAEIAGECF